MCSQNFSFAQMADFQPQILHFPTCQNLGGQFPSAAPCHDATVYILFFFLPLRCAKSKCGCVSSDHQRYVELANSPTMIRRPSKTLSSKCCSRVSPMGKLATWQIEKLGILGRIFSHFLLIQVVLRTSAISDPLAHLLHGRIRAL